MSTSIRDARNVVNFYKQKGGENTEYQIIMNVLHKEGLAHRLDMLTAINIVTQHNHNNQQATSIYFSG